MATKECCDGIFCRFIAPETFSYEENEPTLGAFLPREDLREKNEISMECKARRPYKAVYKAFSGAKIGISILFGKQIENNIHYNVLQKGKRPEHFNLYYLDDAGQNLKADDPQIYDRAKYIRSITHYMSQGDFLGEANSSNLNSPFILPN